MFTMMNNLTLVSLMARYNSIAYTHDYICGFAYKHNIYMTMSYGLNFGLVLSRASSKNGGSMTVRFQPTSAEKQALIDSCQCELLCTEDYLLQQKAELGYNKGEIFEKLVTEKFGQEWTKDNVPFDKGADLTTDEKSYSIKYEKATMFMESTLVKRGV